MGTYVRGAMNIGWAEKGIVLTKKHKKAFVSAFISQTRGENENKSLSLGHNCVIMKDNPRRLWIKSHNPELFRLHRRTEAAGLLFTSMGNHFLLDWPDKQVVEMSRSATVSSRLTRWPSDWLKIWIRFVSLTKDNNGYKRTIESDG